MRLEELRPAKGEKRKNKRLARGNGSGHGSTATKGNKGQKARSGGYHKVGFEGGQMPLQRRLPKFGFNNIFKTSYSLINVSKIASMPNDREITPELLVEMGIISASESSSVKILGNGEIKKAYTVKAHKFSKSAVEKISKAGGKAEVIN
ncbi:MAG: 50S ribosomal protein L15 [Oligoflexia bacterium]|nr:50S ribosomal protein L15 [Oligoflexia bacterium]